MKTEFEQNCAMFDFSGEADLKEMALVIRSEMDLEAPVVEAEALVIAMDLAAALVAVDLVVPKEMVLEIAVALGPAAETDSDQTVLAVDSVAVDRKASEGVCIDNLYVS